jgi:hypothetical protein
LAYPGRNDGKLGYYAICIDLNLVTWRPTIGGASESLMDAVRGYLETVSKLSEEGTDWRELVPRPAPFWPHRALYHFLALLRAIPRIWRWFDSLLFEQSVDMPFKALAA